MSEVPSVGKHEIHYVNAAWYWLVLMDVAQKLAFDTETDDEKGLDNEDVLHQLSLSSGAAFAAQMAKTVEAPILEVESLEYSVATPEYQKALAHQVFKATAHGEAARSVRAQGEGPGPAAGRH
ncbi:unnamed protein product [Agarophyton chilense]